MSTDIIPARMGKMLINNVHTVKDIEKYGRYLIY